MFFLGYWSDTSISLNENSVKPNIKADRSGFFISKIEITMKFRVQTEFCQIQMAKLYKIVML